MPAFISEDNKLFVCGFNEYGQLGLGHNDNVKTLIQVENFDNVTLVSYYYNLWHL